MRELILKLKEARAAGTEIMLVTIVDHSGSVPRETGARMAVAKDGRIAGTIGGGILEHKCILTAMEALSEKKSFQEHFALHPDSVADLGMICGGEVEVAFRYLAAKDTAWEDVIRELEASVRPGHVYIFGGGHVAQQLVPILTRCDFSCVVVEDRSDFADPALFEYKAKTVVLPMEELEQFAKTITARDFVCVMTRGHQNDYEVQRAILKTPARYIGVIGSRTKIAGVRERLKGDGFTEEDLARIIAPIGIPIGSQTPAEIAVSVAAQLIKECSEGH